MESKYITEVMELKALHQHTWQNRPEWYWMLGLTEEVIELMLSLVGLHKGPIEWELQQIATIALNWLEMRESKINSNNSTMYIEIIVEKGEIVRKMSPHFMGTYRKGRQAFIDGETLDDCPYLDHRTQDGKVTFSRAFQTLWQEGWNDESHGLPDRYISGT